MNILDETYKILGQRFLDEFDSKKLVKWAVNAINLGCHSESLLILAGLDYESTEEREEYFWKAVDELELNIKREESELRNDYAKYIASAVLNNQFSPKSGLEKMNKVFRTSEGDSKYIQFFKIDEDLDALKYEEYPPIYNKEITLENADQFIIKAFENFLNVK